MKPQFQKKNGAKQGFKENTVNIPFTHYCPAPIQTCILQYFSPYICKMCSVRPKIMSMLLLLQVCSISIELELAGRTDSLVQTF